MATYVERAQAMINAAIDGTATAQQLQRVADAYVEYAPDIVNTVMAARPLLEDLPDNPGEFTVPDESPLTNEEKAQVFVEAYRRWGKSVLRAVAEKNARVANEASVVSAGDSAEGDL